MVKDNIFAQPLKKIEDFKFDEKVASVFANMIKRSVPGYENIIFMLRILAERFAAPNSNCYDLGCSLGASALSLQAGITQPGCKIFAVDNSEAMIKRCRENVAASHLATPIEAVCNDIRDIKFENASIVVSNFTLQFLPVADRKDLLQKIYNGMTDGGVLILSEKITHDNEFTRDLLIDIYHAWKCSNGYSQMEVSQKRSALENVLIPETFDAHRKRLYDIGFKHCEQWFQCFNFISMVAFK